MSPGGGCKVAKNRRSAGKKQHNDCGDSVDRHGVVYTLSEIQREMEFNAVSADWILINNIHVKSN